MDPMALLAGGSKFSLQGGDAAPSSAYSDGKQTVNAWIDSPFSVGAGGTASGLSATPSGMDSGYNPSAGQMTHGGGVGATIPYLAVALIAVVAIKAVA